MRSGEPNGAFVSIENVALRGTDGVTAPQFNSNVFLRAYCAAFFGHAINPQTQLWHAEIDQLNRCFDTGWDGALEDAMQDAANRLLRSDVSGLRGVSATDGTRGAARSSVANVAEVQMGLITKVLNQDWRGLRDDAATLAGGSP
jgi:hypothetical protein